KAVDFYRGKATDKQGENRDLWRVRWTWTLRALTQHDAVKRNLKLFPDRMVKDYLVIFLEIPNPNHGDIAFLGQLGPRAKIALPLLKKFEDSDSLAHAQEAHKAIKLIEAKK